MAMRREEFAAFVKPPQLQFISDCIRKGLSDYADSTNYSPFARLAHTTSLKSHIRNGHIVFRAEQAAHERPELRIRSVTRRNRRLFYINEKGRLSFKKLNKNLRHSNYPTPQALAFDAQLWPRDLLPDVDTAGAHAV